ncbi:MAG: DUF4230 domain-containing protein [Planctomycetota bacterium]
MLTPALLLTGTGLVLGIALTWLLLRRGGLPKPPSHTHSTIIAERVASVGKLVALEVNAKEIATAKQGWDWMPPLVLSQARLAMIFQFEQQFTVDLGGVTASDITPVGRGAEGRRRYRVEMPEIEAALRLTDVTPYDIQHGRVLGLLEVIPMNAERQSELMRRAQDDATRLFGDGERYREAARGAAERQIGALLGLFDADVEIAWPEASSSDDREETVDLEAPETEARPRRRQPSVARVRPAARKRRRPISA